METLTHTAKRRGLLLDPRTKLLMLITVTSLMLSTGNSGVMNIVKPVLSVLPFILLLAAGRYDLDFRHLAVRLPADIGDDRTQYAQRIMHRLGRQSLIASGGALPQQQLHILLHQQRRKFLRIARPDMRDDVMENDVAVFGMGRRLDPVPADGEPFLTVAGKGRLLSAFHI